MDLLDKEKRYILTVKCSCSSTRHSTRKYRKTCSLRLALNSAGVYSDPDYPIKVNGGFGKIFRVPLLQRRSKHNSLSWTTTTAGRQYVFFVKVS